MYYVRTTGGSMMAVTPKSTTVVAVKKEPTVIKSIVTRTNKQALKKD